MTERYRFLLDENFPTPRFDPADVDQSVEYIGLHQFDPDLTSTPDWLIYLRAAEAGFTGLVTRDISQLQQPEELLALMRTDLIIVTWRRPIEDALQEWGQMIAYMPEVLERLEREAKPAIFLLPKPQISVRNIERASSYMGKFAKAQKRSQQQIRDEAEGFMVDELRTQGLERLIPILGR